MTKNTNSQVKKTSSLELIVAILILIAFLVFFYLNPLRLQSLYNVLIFIAGFAVSIAVFFQSSQGLKLKDFLKETKIELLKVVWPSRDETIKTTLIIMLAVVIVAIFLWMVDSFFSWIVHFLTK